MSQKALNPGIRLQEVVSSLQAGEDVDNVLASTCKTGLLSDVLQVVEEAVEQTDVCEVVDMLNSVLTAAIEASKATQNDLVSSMLERFLSFTFDHNVFVAYRLETLRNLNIILQNSSLSLRHGFLNKNGFIDNLGLLFTAVHKAGDYEFQVCLIECLFRLLPKGKKVEIAKILREENSFLVDSFLSIRGTHFDFDCRKILNKINQQNLSEQSRVITLPAEMVKIDGEKVLKPSDEDYDQLWVDFNTGSGRIAIFIEPNLPQSQLSEGGENMWETVSIWQNDLAKYDCVAQGGMWRAVLEVKPAALMYSSREPDDQRHLVVIQVSTEYMLQDALAETFKDVPISSQSQKRYKASAVASPVSLVTSYTGGAPSKSEQAPAEIQATVPELSSNNNYSQSSQQSVRRSGTKMSVPLMPMRDPASTVCSSDNSWYLANKTKPAGTAAGVNTQQARSPAHSRCSDDATSAKTRPQHVPGLPSEESRNPASDLKANATTAVRDSQVVGDDSQSCSQSSQDKHVKEYGDVNKSNKSNALSRGPGPLIKCSVVEHPMVKDADKSKTPTNSDSCANVTQSVASSKSSEPTHTAINITSERKNQKKTAKSNMQENLDEEENKTNKKKPTLIHQNKKEETGLRREHRSSVTNSVPQVKDSVEKSAAETHETNNASQLTIAEVHEPKSKKVSQAKALASKPKLPGDDASQVPPTQSELGGDNTTENESLVNPPPGVSFKGKQNSSHTSGSRRSSRREVPNDKRAKGSLENISSDQGITKRGVPDETGAKELITNVTLDGAVSKSEQPISPPSSSSSSGVRKSQRSRSRKRSQTTTSDQEGSIGDTKGSMTRHNDTPTSDRQNSLNGRGSRSRRQSQNTTPDHESSLKGRGSGQNTRPFKNDFGHIDSAEMTEKETKVSKEPKTPPARSTRTKKKVKTPVVTVQPCGGNSKTEQISKVTPTAIDADTSEKKSSPCIDEEQQGTEESLSEPSNTNQRIEKSDKEIDSNNAKNNTNVKEKPRASNIDGKGTQQVKKYLISPGNAVSQEEFKAPKKLFALKSNYKKWNPPASKNTQEKNNPTKANKNNDADLSTKGPGEDSVNKRHKRLESKKSNIEKNAILNKEKEQKSAKANIEKNAILDKEKEQKSAQPTKKAINTKTSKASCENQIDSVSEMDISGVVEPECETDGKKFEVDFNIKETSPSDKQRRGERKSGRNSGTKSLMYKQTDEDVVPVSNEAQIDTPAIKSRLDTSTKDLKTKQPATFRKIDPCLEDKKKDLKASKTCEDKDEENATKTVPAKQGEKSVTISTKSKNLGEKGQKEQNKEFPDYASSCSSGFLYIEADDSVNEPRKEKCDDNISCSSQSVVAETQKEKLTPGSQAEKSTPGSQAQIEKLSPRSQASQLSLMSLDEKALDLSQKNKVNKARRLSQVKAGSKVPFTFGFDENELNASGDYNVLSVETPDLSNHESSYVFGKAGCPNVLEGPKNNKVSDLMSAPGTPKTLDLDDASSALKSKCQKDKVPKKPFDHNQEISSPIVLPGYGGGDGFDTSHKKNTKPQMSSKIQPTTQTKSKQKLDSDAKTDKEKDDSDVSLENKSLGEGRGRQLRKRNKQVCYKEIESVCNTTNNTPRRPITSNQLEIMQSSQTHKSLGKFKTMTTAVDTMTARQGTYSKVQRKTIWRSQEVKTTTMTTTSYQKVIQSSGGGSDPYSFEDECDAPSAVKPFQPFRSFVFSNNSSQDVSYDSVCEESTNQNKEKNVIKPNRSKSKNSGQRDEYDNDDTNNMSNDEEEDNSKKRKKAVTTSTKSRAKESAQFASFSSMKTPSRAIKEKFVAKKSMDFTLFSSQRSQKDGTYTPGGLVFPPLEDSIPCTPYEEITHFTSHEDQDDVESTTFKSQTSGRRSWLNGKTPAAVRERKRGKTYKTNKQKKLQYKAQGYSKDWETEEEEADDPPYSKQKEMDKRLSSKKVEKEKIALKKIELQTPQTTKALCKLDMEVTPGQSPGLAKLGILKKTPLNKKAKVQELATLNFASDVEDNFSDINLDEEDNVGIDSSPHPATESGSEVNLATDSPIKQHKIKDMGYTQISCNKSVSKPKRSSSDIDDTRDATESWKMLSHKNLDRHIQEVFDKVSGDISLDEGLNDRCLVSGPSSTVRPKKSALKRKYADLALSSTDQDEVSEKEESHNKSAARELFRNSSSRSGSEFSFEKDWCVTTPKTPKKRLFPTKSPMAETSPALSNICSPKKKSALKRNNKNEKQLAINSPQRKKRKSQRKLELSPMTPSKPKHSTNNSLSNLEKSITGRLGISFDLPALSPAERGRNAPGSATKSKSNTKDLSSTMSPHLDLSTLFPGSPHIELPQSPEQLSDIESPPAPVALLDTIKSDLMNPVTSQQSEGSSECFSSQWLESTRPGSSNEMDACEAPKDSSFGGLRGLLARKHNIGKPSLSGDVESTAKSTMRCIKKKWDEGREKRLNAVEKYQNLTESILKVVNRDAKSMTEWEKTTVELWEQQSTKLKRHWQSQEKQLKKLVEVQEELRDQLQETQTEDQSAQKAVRTILKRDIQTLKRKLEEKYREHSLEAIKLCLQTSFIMS